VSGSRLPASGLWRTNPRPRLSRRTLPLDDAPIAALMALKAKQAQERLAGGKVYTPACTDVVGPISPLMRSAAASVPSGIPDQFRRLFKAAGLPVIRLHDARHTFVS